MNQSADGPEAHPDIGWAFAVGWAGWLVAVALLVGLLYLMVRG